MVIKSKIFIKCNDKEFDCWDFCKNWISNSNLNCIFLIGDYHIWSFTGVERKSVGLQAVINTCQFPIHSFMNIVNVTVRSKNCCIVSKMNKTHLIWGSIHVVDIQKKKYGPTDPCGTPNVMFDIEEVQFLIETYEIRQIRLKPALYDTLAPLCRSLLINMSWLTVSNAFEKSRYTAIVLCLLSND